VEAALECLEWQVGRLELADEPAGDEPEHGVVVGASEPEVVRCAMAELTDVYVADPGLDGPALDGLGDPIGRRRPGATEP
jgi:hypothetical protein